MSTRFPLQTLLDVSQLRLDEAARRLGELMRGEQDAKTRVELLIDYRAEYHSRFVAAAQNGIAPTEWHNFRSFLSKLDAAVDQAAALLAQSRDQTARGQQLWLDRRSNVKAYDTLADRHRDGLNQKARRQEQKSADEHATRRFLDDSTRPMSDDDTRRHD